MTASRTAPPFTLPARGRTTRLRGSGGIDRPDGREQVQALPGYDRRYVDIVDYIVGITDEIWNDGAVGRIYDTYDPACVVYSAYGVLRSVDEVVASTVATLASFPEDEARHLNVAWSEEQDGFYTSHLGFSRSTNIGSSGYGPATGRQVGIHFIADCVSRANRIHTEWLVADSGSMVRQLGFDLHECARRFAASETMERFVVSPPRPDGQAPSSPGAAAADTPDSFARRHFADVWTLRRLDLLGRSHAPDVVAHWPGGRDVGGVGALRALMVAMLASFPGAVVRVQHVCWSEEADGVILAARWVLEGATSGGGLLGEVPPGRIVFVPGMSHFRFGADGLIVEEWTIFDEVGALVQAYRG